MIWILLSLVGVVGTFFTACLPLLLKHFLMFETFIVTNRGIMENISERIASTGWCATWVVSSKQMPSGLCFMMLKGGALAWFWIRASYGESDMPDFRVICSKTVFNIISKPRSTSILRDACGSKGADQHHDGEDGDTTYSKKFCTVNRIGPYTWIGYEDGIVPWVPEPRDWQVDAVDAIISTYTSRTNHNNAAVLVTSPPGKGKSTIAVQVAQRLDGRFCKSFNPTDPGDSLSILVRETRPSLNSPLVILIDEVDQMLIRVHANLVPMHKNAHTQVKDKCGWNTLLDDIANQTKYVILIMTSNLSRNAIAAMLGDDPSYLRDGRVHMCIETA